jgi:hypothetical protein
MLRVMKLTGGYFPGGGTRDPATVGFYNIGNLDLQNTDRSIFDYRENLFSGGASTQGSDFRLLTGSIEGSWWDNKVGIELAAFDQTYDTWGFNSLQGIENRTISIDINRYMIAKDSSGNWIPNPGFGLPQMGGAYGGNDLYSNRESLRATGFLELRAEDFMEESWIQKLLGRLKITGVLQDRKSESKEAYGGRGGVDPQALADAIGGGNIFNLPNTYFRKGQAFALPSKSGVDFLGANSLSDLSGARIGGVPYGSQRDRPPNPGTYTGLDQTTGTWKTFEVPVYTLRDNDNFYSSFFSGKSATEIKSQVLVGQSYLWDDTIVLMGTWRNDEQRSGSVGAPSWQPYAAQGDTRGLGQHEDVFNEDFVRGPKDLALDADEDTTSWSIMIHTPEFIKQHLPAGTELSVYKSKADNFRPSGGRVNVLNESIDAITGSTEEKGFIISTLDGKLVTRFNWYETTQANNSFDVGGVSPYAGILVNLVEQLDNPANVAQGFTVADAQAVLPPQGVQDVSGFKPNWSNFTAEQNRNSGDNGTQDFTAKGMEVEIAYNPTPRWTMIMTIAEQETLTSNTYPVLRELVNDFILPTWVNSSFAQNYFINDDATETLAEISQRAIVDPVLQATTLDGIPKIEQRKWRVNFNTSYNFGRDNDILPSWLGDFTVGGGLRWEDQAVIGYGLYTNEFGNLAYNPDDAYYAPEMTYIDLFFRASYELSDRTDMILQLNIKDLTDHDGLVPFYTNPDGSQLYRFLEGRLITASATFTF